MSIRAVRRVETGALIFLAGVIALRSAQAAMVALDVPLLATAAAVFPRPPRRMLPRWDARATQLIDDLFSYACDLRARYEQAREVADLPNRVVSPIDVRRDIEKWISFSRARMRSFPEFRAIFESHGGSNVISELEGRIQRLDEIRGLVAISTRIGLQI